MYQGSAVPSEQFQIGSYATSLNLSLRCHLESFSMPLLITENQLQCFATEYLHLDTNAICMSNIGIFLKTPP